ncbi:MAG: sulfatase-like hydrolase/transferase, partial [Chlamydiia bacterium]|nr:sulfatase-like hydrolase/transferase [Chlamydiia bacterium]
DHFKKLYEGNPNVGKEEIMVLAMIKSLDESVGQLTDVVKELGIEDNTIIVFTSDNGHYKTKGSNMFAKPYNGNKGKTLEGGIRVPYIFKWKGHIKPKTVSTEPIIHVDLYPTLVKLSGNKLVDGYILDGEDLTPILLDSKKKTERDALVWEYTNYAGYNTRKGVFASEWLNVIQMDGYKLTEVVESGNYYMYNLNDDPYETTEVIKNFPKQAKKMKKRLEKWKKHTGYVGPVANPDYKGKL